ncbi:MAG TPA: DUF2127 domain-containing protein [Pirellulales bacterium]|nr:DUF2127 domain-containing protein [Pirellulales bacterium]
MSETLLMDQGHERSKPRRDWIVVAIGVFKLFKAALLLAVAFGAIQLLHHDAAETIARWAHTMRVDPGNHIFNMAASKVLNLDERQLHELSAGSFFYAALLLTEGCGLLAQRRWAEYFTIFITGSLIPMELYEIWRRVTILRVAILVINIAAVWYLVYRLRHDKEGSRTTGSGLQENGEHASRSP